MTINIKSPHEYLNATVVGTPTIVDGVVSGFTTSSYLTIPMLFRPEGNPWESVMCFNTGSDVTTAQVIDFINHNGSSVGGAFVQIYNGKTNMALSSNGSSFDIVNDAGGKTAIQLNARYYVKLMFTGSEYRMYLSTTGEFNGEETLEASVTSSALIYQNNTLFDRLGARNNSQPFLGSIDLNESYIKINGEYWWKGMELDQYKEIKRLYKYDKPRYFKTIVESNMTDWVQPVLTSNGTMGGDKFACAASSEGKDTYGIESKAYYVFDADSAVNQYGGRTSWSRGNGWLSWYNPVKLKISSIDIACYDYAGTEWQLQYSDDNVDWKTIKTFTAPTGDETITLDLSSDNILAKYWRVNLPSAVFGYIVSIKITAQTGTTTTTTIEVTADDEYDYIEFNPITIKQVYKTDEFKYYKYVAGDTDWTQPVNPTGITATSGWGSPTNAFDGNASTYATCGTTTDYIEWDLGTEVYLSGITATGDRTSGVSRANNLIVKSVNEDGTETTLGKTTGAAATQTYTLTTSFSETLVSKLRFYLTNGENNELPSTSYKARIKEINLTATKQHTQIPTNLKEIPFTFPELTSEGSIGGDEFGVQAYGEVTGLMNMFQPLVDGKPANGVYTDVPGAGSYFILYSPKPFYYRGVTLYYGADEDGEVIYPKELDVDVTALNENGEWIYISNIRKPYPKETPYEGGYKEGSHFADAYKLYRFEPYTEIYGVKIGKLIIHGYIEEPLTASDDYDYKELIPTLVYEDNGTVFEQSTAGTYTFVVTEAAPYEITLVGGGGGGAFNSSGNAGSAAAGNSGSGLVVNANLKAGTYVLTVGAGGAKSGWLDANTWGGNGAESKITKDGVVIATAGGGTGNHCWWRSGSERNSTVGAAPTYTDALGVTDVILNTQGNWGGLAATSSGGASVISGTTWGKGGDTRDRNAADNGNAGCIRIVRLEK